MVSLDDPLMRIFAKDNIRVLLGRLGMNDGTPIENSMVAKTVENLATTLAPGVFAGADDEEYVEGLGGWDPETGQWIPDMGALEEEDMQGISFLPGTEPSGLSNRPQGL